jgi:RimJ/RimL family protein N-acetyltransferase
MTPLPPTPVLETERLIIRPLALRDTAATQRLFPQWPVVRWLHAGIPWPYPADGAATNIAESLALRDRGEKFFWTITLKGDDALRGRIDLWPAELGNRDMRGFWLDPELHGQGLMLEAANAVTGYAFDALGWPQLYLTNAVPNRASARIKEKQGAVEIDREPADYVSGPAQRQVWRLTPESWRARPAPR